MKIAFLLSLLSLSGIAAADQQPSVNAIQVSCSWSHDDQVDSTETETLTAVSEESIPYEKVVFKFKNNKSINISMIPFFNIDLHALRGNESLVFATRDIKDGLNKSGESITQSLVADHQIIGCTFTRL